MGESFEVSTRTRKPAPLLSSLGRKLRSPNITVAGLVRVQKPFRILTNQATRDSFVRHPNGRIRKQRSTGDVLAERCSDWLHQTSIQLSRQANPSAPTVRFAFLVGRRALLRIATFRMPAVVGRRGRHPHGTRTADAVGSPIGGGQQERKSIAQGAFRRSEMATLSADDRPSVRSS